MRKVIIPMLINKKNLKENSLVRETKFDKDIFKSYLILDEENENIEFLTIDKLRETGFTPLELDELADKNYRKLFDFRLNYVKDFIFADENETDKLTNYLKCDKIPSKDDMMVLRNTKSLFGATILLFDDVREKILSLYGCDVAIIPSSVHEMLIIPKDNMTYENICEMMEIGDSVLPPKEYLGSKPIYLERK